MAQISNAPRSQEIYITQVSEEIEGRVTKKLSQEFSRTENRFLGALSCLDDFIMNPLIQGHSEIAPVTSRNAYGTNQGTNEDDSQSDPHPEASIFQRQTTRNFDPEMTTTALQSFNLRTWVKERRIRQPPTCELHIIDGRHVETRKQNRMVVVNVTTSLWS